MIPRALLTVLNQIYEIEKKLIKQGDHANLGRNINRIKDAFGTEGIPATGLGGDHGPFQLVYEDPMGQAVKETRTDLEATISGSGTDNLVVVDVLKPIIRMILGDGVSRVVQRGVVIVESRKDQMP